MKVCKTCGIDYTNSRSYGPGDECPICRHRNRLGVIQEVDKPPVVERLRSNVKGSVRVLVCGSRHWSSLATIRAALDSIPEVGVVIEGGARGADRLAKRAAEDMGLPVDELSARWNEYGKAAGPIRNQKMLDEGDPDIVLAFHDNLEESKGTKDMLGKAVNKEVPVVVCQS